MQYKKAGGGRNYRNDYDDDHYDDDYDYVAVDSQTSKKPNDLKQADPSDNRYGKGNQNHQGKDTRYDNQKRSNNYRDDDYYQPKSNYQDDYYQPKSNYQDDDYYQSKKPYEGRNKNARGDDDYYKPKQQYQDRNKNDRGRNYNDGNQNYNDSKQDDRKPRDDYYDDYDDYRRDNQYPQRDKGNDKDFYQPRGKPGNDERGPQGQYKQNNYKKQDYQQDDGYYAQKNNNYAPRGGKEENSRINADSQGQQQKHKLKYKAQEFRAPEGEVSEKPQPKESKPEEKKQWPKESKLEEKKQWPKESRPEEKKQWPKHDYNKNDSNQAPEKLQGSSLYCNASEMYAVNKQKQYLNENKKPHVKSIQPGKTLNVLMIAEKPSIASSISEILGKKHETHKSVTPIHSFMASFFGHKANLTVSSVTGHVFNRDFPAKYQSWQKTDPLSLFTAETIKNDADDSGKMDKHLQHLAKGKDIIVLWLDNDREGENICFEILDVVFDKLNSNFFRRIYRARFYSLVDSEIRNAYNSVDQGPDHALSMAVDGRQILDLKVGVAFTRYQSMYMKEKYVEFKDKVLSYGPCQTPTLGLVVTRDKNIDDFKPRKYYKVIYNASLNPSNPDSKQSGDVFEVNRLLATLNISKKLMLSKCEMKWKELVL